jgi:hypothetical protein
MEGERERGERGERRREKGERVEWCRAGGGVRA